MNRLDPIQQPGFGVVTALALLALFMPVLLLVVLSFNSGTLFHRWEGWSLQWYGSALTDPGFRRAALNSAIIGLAATVLATAIATMAAFALESRPSLLAGSVIDLPLVIPEIVMAIGILAAISLLRGATGIDLGMGNLIFAHTMFCIPFAMGPIRALLRRLDPQLAIAAADLYATPRRIFARITLPLLMPGIASGAALAFIVSFDDFAISQLVAGPGQTTLPVFIWAQLRRPLTPEVNAICAIVLAVSLVIVCLSAALAWPRHSFKPE